MAQTSIPFGHPLARKVYGAAVFAELVRAPTLLNRLTGAPPDISEAKRALEKMQTSPNYPVVRINDLTTKAGDVVGVDVFNVVQGRPVMGDRKLSGRMMGLTSSTMDLRINQMRGGVDAGGRMAQQRTEYDLRTIGRAGLAGWWARALEQIKLVHLAGARGSHDATDWVVPLANDPEFADIMVNPVQPPTFDKHFYAGDATGLADLDGTNILTLDDIDRLRASIDEMDNPMAPIILPDDPASMDEPMFVLMVTPRVWHYLQNRTGEKAWRTFLQNARERGSKNPLFTGEPGMWNGILIKKMSRPIRFFPGDTVVVSNNDNDATVTTATINPALGGANAANYSVDRCLLLGAQALAEAWGKDSKSGTHMNWHEEVTDHGNTYEASVAGVGGWSKFRFKNSSGKALDNGVAVIDVVTANPQKVVIA